MKLVWAFLFAALFGLRAEGESPANLIVCGMEKVFILPGERGDEGLWEWSAKSSPSIPKSMYGAFATTDECKPYRGSLLITSSSGGVALIERETKKCLFCARVRNAHSACLLPGGLVAVASSFGGDQMVMFDLEQSGSGVAPKVKIPLYGAHGVEWDQEQKCLWALGTKVLLKIEVKEAEALVAKEFKLPMEGGHDLSWWSDREFVLSVDHHCYLFSIREQEFKPFKPLVNESKVKSIDRSRSTGRVVWHQGSKETWWSDTIRFLNPNGTRVLGGEKIYKVRWDEPRIRPTD